MRLALACLSLVLFGTAQAQVTVVNGASFRSEQPVAPGSFATIKGSFTGVPLTFSSGYPLPKTLAGVSIQVDGIDAPIFAVSDQQINFLIPFGATIGVRPIQVKAPSGNLTGTVRVVSAAPGIFPYDTTTANPPHGAVLNADGSINSATNPIKRGGVISMFATGGGALSTAVADGAAPNAVVTTKSTPQVYIGGVEAQLFGSAMSPQYAGIWQINVYIPDKPFISGTVPVTVYQDGVDSNEVTVFVAQ